MHEVVTTVIEFQTFKMLHANHISCCRVFHGQAWSVLHSRFALLMNMSILRAILTSTLVNLSGARLTSRARKDKPADQAVLGLHPYEHKYYPDNADIYACEPQYYRGKTYIKGGER